VKTVAIIPARGGSKGLKRKNILPLLDIPLIAYSIKSGINSSNIDMVIVSTEDEEIAQVSKDAGAEVPFMRPLELAADVTPTLDVLKYTIEMLEERLGEKINNIVLLQPTSPLRNHLHIDEAFDVFLKNGQKPVVSVTEAKTHPNMVKRIENNQLVNFLDTAETVTRRQDLKKVYELNGAIYITTRDMIINENRLYGDEVFPYLMEKQDSVDIDDRLDFLFAELLMKEMRK
jgi:CMP-N,N'-diacetyllegionaminic acid synthase